MSDYLSYVLDFEIMRYGIIGVLSLGAYYLVYSVCTLLKKEWYQLWAILAFVAYMSVSFPLQKYWTFGDVALDTVELQLVAFGLQRIAGQILNNIMLAVVIARLEPSYVFSWMIADSRLHPIPAQMIVHLIMFLPTYLVTKVIFGAF